TWTANASTTRLNLGNCCINASNGQGGTENPWHCLCKLARAHSGQDNCVQQHKHRLCSLRRLLETNAKNTHLLTLKCKEKRKKFGISPNQFNHSWEQQSSYGKTLLVDKCHHLPSGIWKEMQGSRRVRTTNKRSNRPELLKIHHKVDKILDNIISERREILASTKLQESSGLELCIKSNNVKAVIMVGMLAIDYVIMVGYVLSRPELKRLLQRLNGQMVEIIRNPRVMEKAQVAIREALKQRKTIGKENIQELSYLKLVIKETLRLHNHLLLLIPRECREECKIGGYNIPMKTEVIIDARAMGKDPN
ncbi:hypothetical protein RJ639_022693, partial [Escallonia herrerae]